MLTLEIADSAKTKENGGSMTEFTDGAHLRQVLCLMPSDKTDQAPSGAAADSSSDESDEDELNPMKK